MFGWIRWLLAFGALLAGMAGVVLQVTLRDEQTEIAPLFYLLPLPVSGALLLVAMIFTRRGWWRKFLGLIAIATLGWWTFQSCGWAYPIKGRWKVMTWNLARPSHPFAPLIGLARAEKPDVIVLIESGNLSPAVVSNYKRALPGYRMVAETNGLSCLVRGEILASSVSRLVNGSVVAVFRARLGGEEFRVFAADLGADPLLPRGPQIAMLAEMTHGRPRTLVIGDFNVPLESVHLHWMRTSFTEAREGPHRGFRETWFYGLPLLSLDQVWCSRDLKPVFATKRLTTASDHSPVIVTIDQDSPL